MYGYAGDAELSESLFRKLREKSGVDEKELTRLWLECARVPVA